MKTWILVWLLIYPPAGPNKDVTWEYSREINLTQQECIDLLVEKDIVLKQETLAGNLIGHELYCKEEK